jgi:hypothetical protein
MTTRDRSLAVLVAITWGLNFLAIYASLEHFPPMFCVALRFGLIAIPTVLLVPRPDVELRWLIGYGALWLAVKDLDVYRPPSGAFIVFGLCISSAVVFTIVHSVRRAAGMRGPSVTAGAMYGWAWGLGFLLQAALIGAFVNAGASHELVALASNGLACLIVGLLYMAGGAMDQEPALFWLGVWILVVAAVASSVGLHLTFLVMALAGGGGFLVGAGIEHARRRARRGPAFGSAARTA